jgi:DNA polymerase III delta prime subunit
MLDYLINLYDSNKLPNLLLYGNNLLGKKTLLEHLLLHIYKTYENIENNTLILNCSLGKGNIKFIRENLKFFANTITHKTISTFKSIVLLNADKLTLDAQSALRRSIELCGHSKFFIITDNRNKLIKPILSRFSNIFCNELNMGKVYKSLTKISNVNNQYNKISVIVKELDGKFCCLALTQLTHQAICYEKNKLLLHYCILIYNKGISANNLLDYFKNNQLYNSEYYKFIFCYDIYKKEIRVEIFLIFIILYYYKINNKFNFSLFNNN